MARYVNGLPITGYAPGALLAQLAEWQQAKLLSLHGYYKAKNFLACIRALPAYPAYIRKLHRLQKTSTRFGKWWNRTVGKVPECLDELYQELANPCTPAQESSSSIPANHNFPLSYQTHTLLNVCDLDPDSFTLCQGTQEQVQLHAQLVDILEKLGITYTKYTDTTVRTLAKSTVNFADVARQYNNTGHTQQASLLTDACWALVDYTTAVAEGLLQGATGTIHSIIHPIQTIQGITHAGYMLGKVLYRILDADITLLYDNDTGVEKCRALVNDSEHIWLALKAKYHSTPGRELVKQGVTCITEGYLTGKALRAMHTWYTAAKAEALATPLLETESWQELFTHPHTRVVHDAFKAIEYCKQNAINLQECIAQKIIPCRPTIVITVAEEITLPAMIEGLEGEFQQINIPQHSLICITLNYGKMENYIMWKFYMMKQLGKFCIFYINQQQWDHYQK